MAKELLLTRSPSPTSVILSRLSLCLGILYVVLLGSLHLIKPEVDPLWQFISEYALGHYGWIMVLTFFSLAASLLTLLLSIASQVKTILGYIGIFLVLLSVVGISIAGLFPTDPTTVSQDSLTESGKMHVLGASLDWTPFGALFISLSLVRTKAWAPLKKPLLIASLTSVVLTIIFIGSAATVSDGKFGPGTFAGLAGRLVFISYLGWIGVIAKNVIRMRQEIK